MFGWKSWEKIHEISSFVKKISILVENREKIDFNIPKKVSNIPIWIFPTSNPNKYAY
jgi:hypothetical protein